MSRRDDFVLLVQTMVLKAPIHTALALGIMRDAMQLPEEAFPAPLAVNDVVDFVEHCRDAAQCPKWLAEFHENEKSRANRVRITVNVEETDERDTRDEWWMNAEALAEPLPKSCLPIVCDRVNHVDVSRADADRFIEWAQSVPGWSETCPPFRVGRVPVVEKKTKP